MEFPDYVGEKFVELDVDGDSFLELTDKDLSEIGIKIGDKKKLLKLIQLCHRDEEQSLEPPPVNLLSDSGHQKNVTERDLSTTSVNSQSGFGQTNVTESNLNTASVNSQSDSSQTNVTESGLNTTSVNSQSGFGQTNVTESNLNTTSVNSQSDSSQTNVTKSGLNTTSVNSQLGSVS